MKKKILLILLFLNILPIFATAQNIVSSDTTTVKIDNSQQIRISNLKKEISNLKKEIQVINKNSLKIEDGKSILEQNKKDSRNSPIWMIGLVVSLYVGIFIFLSISVANIKNIPPSMGLLISVELRSIVFVCILGIIMFFTLIFLFDCFRDIVEYLCEGRIWLPKFFYYEISCFYIFTILNFMIAAWSVRRSIKCLNIYKLTERIFQKNPEGFKDVIEFYINKKEIAVLNNILNSILTNIKLKKKKKKIEESISKIRCLFDDESLVYHKSLFKDVFKKYIKILFATQDVKFIKSEIDIFFRNISGLEQHHWEHPRKLYENANESFVFIIEEAIKDNYMNKKESFVNKMIVRFTIFTVLLIRNKNIDSFRYVVNEMKRIMMSDEFSEKHFIVLKNHFKRIFDYNQKSYKVILDEQKKKEEKEINSIIIYFLYKIIVSCVSKNVSSDLIICFIEDSYNFGFLKCKEYSLWIDYLKKMTRLKTQKTVNSKINKYWIDLLKFHDEQIKEIAEKVISENSLIIKNE